MTLAGLGARVRRRAGRVRGPEDRVARCRTRWRPDRSLPGRDARTAADRPRHVRAARGDRRPGAHARVQPAAARAVLTADRGGAMARLDDRGIHAPRRRGATGHARAAADQRPSARGRPQRRPSPVPMATGRDLAAGPAASSTNRRRGTASRRSARRSGPARSTAGRAARPRASSGNGATRVATAVRHRTPTALESLSAIDWVLPGTDLLEPRAAGRVGAGVDHESNKRRIEEKLLSFSIPAKVVAVNSGPVVTQYEVRPEHHVKVSRIEALADDLAMALAARSIRIEAPIPGKDVVGIEIPNSVSEVVGFKPLVDESVMLDSTSPLTFALGRDVSGKAYAVDLAKMPHLLDRRRDRLGQERLRQRAHHQPPHARPARRGAPDPGRPQARRAGAVQRAAAPPPARHRRAGRGEGRAELGRARDGGSLQAPRRPRRAQHRRLQRPPDRASAGEATTASGCRTSC